MYITLENLRNMARPKRITSAPSGISRKDNVNEYEMQRKDNVNEYERQRELNIQQNNRKLQEFGIQRTIQAPRRAKGSIQLRGEQNCEEDDEYHPTDDERVLGRTTASHKGNWLCNEVVKNDAFQEMMVMKWARIIRVMRMVERISKRIIAMSINIGVFGANFEA
ncbi:hypothetical protein Cgig2_028743 [Carnegiea gigantea]|uniref:Uncharacterized protein n=1 Tax=Carnegiea gigantea TaxID=171969 RepID=A0A9Q1JKW6_9CARY|nr:hypothetical protein Cgig2_028743 [Carnegiea gigantea]